MISGQLVLTDKKITSLLNNIERRVFSLRQALLSVSCEISDKLMHRHRPSVRPSVRAWVNGWAIFYRAMHVRAERGIGIACRRSVRPSVCNVGGL